MTSRSEDNLNMPADYLSDEDAERMARAYFPEFWAALDRDGPRNDRAAEMKRETIDKMKRGWAARPASARSLDAALLQDALLTDWDDAVQAALEAAIADRACHLLLQRRESNGSSKNLSTEGMVE